jgi:DNA-binding PadR family transcriptional regulator
VLHRLEGQGAIESYWVGSEGSRRRKYYRITPAGRDSLVALVDQWKLVDGTLDGLIHRRKRDV